MPHIAGPNHTQIPNVILESMAQMGNAELRVVLAVCRKTFGWQKRQDLLSLTQIQMLTGLSRQGTIDGIDTAISNEWVKRKPYGQSYVYMVNLVDQSESGTSQASRPELVKPVDQLDEELVKPVDTQKKVLKESKEKNLPRKERAACATKKPTRTLTPLQAEQKRLETLFAELTGHPIPPGKAATIWHITTAAWIKAANGRSEEVMRRAIVAHGNLSIKGPQSVDYKFYELMAGRTSETPEL